MKVLIIGATGMAGHALVDEFVARGHQVSAMARDEKKAKEIVNPKANLWLVEDVFALSKEDFSGFDVIVNAFGTAPQTAYLHTDLAARLVHFFRETQTPRLVFILGAGSLKDENGELLLRKLENLPDASHWVSIPINAYKELLFLREVDNVNWVGVSPSIDFIDGEAYDYQTGEDVLLVGRDQRSVVTNRTMAKAIADEVENPKYLKTRFTVVDL